MIRHMLSTKDNPFNPFDEFDQWLQFDISRGYYSCNVLAAHALVTDDQISKEEDEELVNEAIDEIIKMYPLVGFIKVTKEY